MNVGDERTKSIWADTAVAPEAAQLANIASGVVVGKLGTATASPSELRAALAGL